MKRDRCGVSPIVATVMLIGITVMTAAPLATFFSSFYSPVRITRVDVQVYAGLVNENVIRFHIQHVGGQTIRDPLGIVDPNYAIRGRAWSDTWFVDNDIYCWTFRNPERFRQADWAYAEVQLHKGGGAGWSLYETITIDIYIGRGTSIFTGDVVLDDANKIPG